ncbi:circularly permuted type 2 ATP-grasp protein [Methylocella sp.]|uniref:circularly permuted type 2 ATP-grasp protein n=1 Tax=Methylocella sp. TaxID=1978226 RepID=UPI003782D277
MSLSDAIDNMSEPSPAQRLSAMIDGYRPLPGIPDEFIGEDGKPRPYWLRYLNSLTQLGDEEIGRRFAAADRNIRDTGVFYRSYGETAERPWPLSHIPLLIESREWEQIARGVEQRAELLERILADVYGEGRLIAAGDLPAAVVAGSPDFLHPLHGVRPPGGTFLQFIAVDLGRGPDGRWWVLGDRAQAPSGAGYALANRLVLSRAFPALYRGMNVERLAPFFQAFRVGLSKLATRSDPRICLWTPGPLNETYFEQAYLARYLGFVLVEGGDLTVRDDKVHVRTIAGLKQADVLWRRVDGDYADPIELNSQSRLGVAGLVEAVREGGVVLANALGSGVLEGPAMLSFMPKLCRKILGEDLLLPNIATWWCGQQAERAAVLDNFDELAIAGAFGNPVLRFPQSQPVVAGLLNAEERAKLTGYVKERGVDYVGQEVVNLSTTPVWNEDRLTPRPFVLRVYAARTKDGWSVMPGGFCRISDRADARAVSMGDGVQSADVWVLDDQPVEMVTLLPTHDTARIRRLMGNLPSRAADNLFWLGRYLERVEATLRLIRCLAGRMVNTDAETGNAGLTVSKIIALLVSWHAAPKARTRDPLALSAIALHSDKDYGSALSLVRDARRAASFIRERLSPDTWKLIDDLDQSLGDARKPVRSEAEASEQADAALRVISAISGLAQENMNRGAGWRLFDIGRRVERAINACRFARQFAAPAAPFDDLEVLLDLADSQITYRSRYLMGVELNTVRDMIILDPFNPRSVAFQVERLEEHLASLPVLSDDGMLEKPRRQVVKLRADVATAVAADLDAELLLQFEKRLLELADSIAARYFLQGPHNARADRWMGLA